MDALVSEDTEAESENRLRHDWDREEVETLFDLPFPDIVYSAQRVHRAYHSPARVQLSQLLSIKTGGCPEDCAYCPQSAKYREGTGLANERLMALDAVIAKAQAAKEGGATRYCLGAAWRGPKDRQIKPVCDMIRGVKALGLETCATLGLLAEGQAEELRDAGLDYYNHNIDTSAEYYGEIITTRTLDDRLETLARARAAGLKLCCGGIVGMGEARADRAGMLHILATLDPHPESVPINMLVRVEGTPLWDAEPLDGLEFVRTIAAARILMPKSYVRLSAGREEMSAELQALAFLAGANSIFTGEKLLTTPNPGEDQDMVLFGRLGIEAET